MTAVLAVVVGVGYLAGLATGGSEGTPTPAPSSAYVYPDPRPAPLLSLVDQDGDRFDRASLTGGPTLVFFGYTHCPDVCPATVGVVGQVLEDYGSAMRAIFVTVDPERDTVEWMREYVRYLPKGFTGLSGTPAEVRTTADAWGVRYARVASGTGDNYTMSHTADVYLIDGAGRLRAHFPFGTDAATMLAITRSVMGSGGPAASPTARTSASSAPSPSPSASPSGALPEPLSVEVVSSSIWAGGDTPVILRLAGPSGRINDTSARVTVELRPKGAAGAATDVVPALAVKPPMVDEVSYVAALDIPAPGWWELAVILRSGDTVLAGSSSIPVLDPGTTARLGAPAPNTRTPTLADVGGKAVAVTTDPLPDRRLYSESTADALAAGRPLVLVVDSPKFKVTDACGTALNMVKYLPDRWPSVAFVHLEPLAYDVVTESAVLRGTISNPTLVPAADAWGLAGDPWGPRSMPWIFIVDGDGMVRAKYQGVIGTDDVDVILSMIAAGG